MFLITYIRQFKPEPVARMKAALVMPAGGNCDEIRQHSAWFLPAEAGIHEFGSTYVGAKNRENPNDLYYCPVKIFWMHQNL